MSSKNRQRFINLAEKLIGKRFEIRERPKGKVIPFNQDFSNTKSSL